MTAQDIKTLVLFADSHYPFYNIPVFNSFLNVIKFIKPDCVLGLGDLLDMDVVNHHEEKKGNKRYFEGKRLRKLYDGFQTDIIDKLNEVCPDYCRKIYMFGNHEEWIEKYIDQHPELEGFCEIERNINLDGWEIYPYRKPLKIGKLNFHHGEYTNQYHSAKMSNVFEKNMIYGHLHTFQSFTKVTPIECEPHMSMSVPCMCNINPLYMKDKPSAWVNGFAVVYFLPNGLFNVVPVISSKDHFIFNGKFY